MAGINEIGTGGRRSLNPEINLVPFIDLLSVCICFLLMTAVWLHLGTVQVKQSFGTESADLPKDTYEVVVTMIDDSHATLAFMKGREKTLSLEVAASSKAEFLHALSEQLGGSLAQILAGRNVAIPDLVTAATINPAKAASYGSLVVVMDVLRKAAIVNLAVTPKAG